MWRSRKRSPRSAARRTGSAGKHLASGLLCLLLAGSALAAGPETPDAPPPSAPAAEESQKGGLGGLGLGGGAAVLIGAGAFTSVRKRWGERQRERPEEFVYYHNHTRDGAAGDGRAQPR